MELTVRRAESWDEFKEAWIQAMQFLPWYHEPNPADYLHETEIKELQNEFENIDHYFLLAIADDGSAKGVLEFKCFDSYAANGVVMPGVPIKYRNSEAAHALLEYQKVALIERNISRIVATLKYRDTESASWHHDILKQNDFKINRPESVQMIARIDNLEKPSSNPEEFQIKHRDEFTLDDFSQFAIRSYASTPEDLSIHGWDSSVTNPDVVKVIHKRTMDGVFGNSPSKWWKVAIIDEKPAGYIIGFHIPPRSRGIIGNLGVFPEFRKRGIAAFLIHSLFQEFKDQKLAYAMVGTPSNNTPAIRAYTKAGFRIANYLTQYLREISI
ncbi:MAG: GNAT family N-acetyltransferase [Candidatus Thorarchaeota archaeon]|jgi:ribosomal protein S18 acetylase RimI-like enzyme